MKMDKETKEAIIADLQACLQSSKQIDNKIVEIQFNHIRFLPVLGDLRPLLDANHLAQGEIKRMLEKVEQEQ